MAQLSQKPPDLDDDFKPYPIRSSIVKSPKPPDIEDEPDADELLADAKLSLAPDPVISPVASPPPKSKGFYDSFSEAFEPFTEPLTNVFSRSAKTSADIIDSPRLNRTPWEAQVEGFKAGATEGLGGVLDSMTSPVNLAMEAATLGHGAAAKYGLKTIAKAMRYGVKGLGAATAAEGVKHTAEADGIVDTGMGVAEIAGGLAGTMIPAARPRAKATPTPEALPIKPPYESPIVKRPYETAEYTPEPILDESGRDIAPAQSIIQERPAGNWDTNVIPESLQPKTFDPATLQGLEPTAVPEGVDPITGEILSPRSATKRMGSPDLGPTPEALANKPPDLPETAIPEAVPETLTAEPAPTFESWLDRLKSDRGVLNVTEITDALRGREPSPTKTVDVSHVEMEQQPYIDTPEGRVNVDDVPRWNREAIDRLLVEDIESYISRYERVENQTPGTRAIVAYGRELLNINSRQFAENQRRNSGFGDPPEVREFDSGQRYPTTEDAIHDLSTPNLRTFVESDSNRNLRSYATGVLQERNQSFDEHGNYRDNAEPTTSHTGSDPFDPETSTDANWYTDYQKRLNAKAGKALDEIEATRKTPALERLGKIIGEGRASELTSGEKNIEFDKPAHRNKGKKLHPSTAKSWSDWGDYQLKDHEIDASKPGLDIGNGSSVSSMFPNSIRMVYRDASGVPIGVLETNLSGTGISTLAVSSKLGLRRGKVAFEMLKQAFDRGITEPSGTTSDFTNNLIERVKRLARSEKGELNLDEIYNAINDLISKVSDSKFGQAFGRMIKDETGSADFSFGQNKEGEFDSPTVPINKNLPKKSLATNLSIEDQANIESWYKFKKLYDSGKMTEQQHTQWAEVHNKVKSLKPNGDLEIRPYRFESLPIEEPEFTTYRLPNGEEVKLSTSATKGADVTSFQMKGGKVVEATRVDSTEASSTGRGISRLLKDETGSANAKDPIDALKELFEKSKKGALTPEEMAQAKKLAKEQGAPKAETSPKEYLEGKSKVDTGPIVPENAGVTSSASVVTESLSKRLKKAVDEAGQPNAVAPEEISKLIDEASQTLNQLPAGPEKPGVIRQVLGANKALLTSWDVSAPGRQGKAFMLNKAWWTSLDDMVKAWGSPEAAKMINDSITEHPSGYFTKPVSETGKVGKSFAEKAGLELSSTEEMFNAVLGQKLEKWSGIGKSSRAHTAFLNKLRSDQFVSMMEGAKRAGLDPEKNLNIAEKYATFINDATGRGSVNIGKWKLERNLGALNDVFFAPKNMAGQIRTWNNVLNPYKYYIADPVLRKQALKSLFAIAGLGLGVGEVARLGGALVSNDPTNPDFRKIKIGDTRVDLFGGYQQFPVIMMKLLSGQSTSSISGKATDLTAGRYGQQTRASVAQRFFTNRLSPVGSMIWAWMDGKEFDGKPFEAKRALYERIFPIAAKDIWELAQEDPWMATLFAPSTLMGLTGTQHYTGRN